MTGSHRMLALLSAAALAAAGLTAGISGVATAEPAAPVEVVVDGRYGLAEVPELGLGVNHAIWDSQLGSDETTGLLKAAGVQMMRYPGGSYADIYHWKDHTAPGGYVAPDTDFDTYMKAVKKAKAEPIIIANYGTGTAQEAAEWVEYANKTKRYGVKYWEIGNENYGNGHYGAEWEADHHDDKSPTAYANGVVEFAQAMRAVDPSVKIGAVLTTPGNWPDGIVAEGDDATWNETVLSIAGPHIDFVVLHWYPGGTGIAESLAKPKQVVDIAEQTRALIAEHAGPNSQRIQISLTELNAGAGINTQPGALFAADAYPSLWAAGVFNVDWWNVHNGIGDVTEVAGQTDYGDFGLLSSAGCKDDGVTCEPPFNTPFAPYHALDLLDEFANPGDQLITARTDDPKVRAHAVRRPNGEVAVLLLNQDQDAARQVTLDLTGLGEARGQTTVHTYLNGGTDVNRSHTKSATHTLPPFSLTALVLKTAGAERQSLPDTPGTPTVTEVTDTTATVSWSAGSGGPGGRGGPGGPGAGKPHGPGARGVQYEVYLHGAGGTRLAGRTEGERLELSGLTLGTDYAVTVVATQRRGPSVAASWSSAPARFATGAPAESSCAVKLTKTADWGNGYVGNLDITNTGSEPVDGWELGFEFPRAWASFGSGWNGTWAADGTSVSVTNLDWNAAIAPGATISIGYVGNYGGPNLLPRVFTLNGTTCSS